MVAHEMEATPRNKGLVEAEPLGQIDSIRAQKYFGPCNGVVRIGTRRSVGFGKPELKVFKMFVQ